MGQREDQMCREHARVEASYPPSPHLLPLTEVTTRNLSLAIKVVINPAPFPALCSSLSHDTGAGGRGLCSPRPADTVLCIEGG